MKQQQQQHQLRPFHLPSLLLLAFGLLLHGTLAWTPSPVIHTNGRHPSTVLTRRWAAEEASSSGDNAETTSAAAAEEEQVTDAHDGQLVNAHAENAEVTAIKEEIAKLEEQVKEKHRQLLTVKDLAEEYSKVGYARKVAEMENMRRFRSQMQSSNEFTAVAGVVSEFLPVLDELQRLKALYEGDAFGKNYNAMAGNLQTALLELGVEEYAIPVGSPVDGRRVVVVDTEYSDKFAKNTIVRPLKLGLEIKGNVVRLAECVASLGSEAEAAAAAAAAEAKKATKDAPTDEANDEKN